MAILPAAQPAGIGSAFTAHPPLCFCLLAVDPRALKKIEGFIRRGKSLPTDAWKVNFAASVSCFSRLWAARLDGAGRREDAEVPAWAECAFASISQGGKTEANERWTSSGSRTLVSVTLLQAWQVLVAIFPTCCAPVGLLAGEKGCVFSLLLAQTV